VTAPLLARFDDEMRRHPPAEPGVSIDRCDGIVRAVGSYNMIVIPLFSGAACSEAWSKSGGRWPATGAIPMSPLMRKKRAARFSSDAVSMR